tara:strand:- start:158 stop:514 length:357 start_codon:yes stop_codon:yes gene_type:complete
MSTTQENNHNTHGNNVFVLIEQFFPKEGKLEDIISIAKESSKGIYGVSGLLQAKVLKPSNKNGPVCNVTTWESESAFKTFMKSDAIKELYKSEMMKNIKEWTSDIKILQFDMVDGWHQ